MDAQPAVEHRQQEPGQAHSRVRATLHRRDRVEDGDQTLAAEVFGLERDNDVVASDQGRPRAEVEVGRTVDQGQVVVGPTASANDRIPS